MKFKTFIFKAVQILSERLGDKIASMMLKFELWCLDAKFHEIRTTGRPFIRISQSGKLIIGRNFAMHNSPHGNPIGIFTPCCIVVGKGATLKIGDNCGISMAALIAADNITIGDNVKLGGGVKIYTTDFHSLDANLRRRRDTDCSNCNNAPVTIGSDVFIGADSLILKGVTIGEGAIVGAGSVVTKDIPAHQIWAGNPARFIRDT